MVLLSQKGFLQLGPDVLAVFELRSGIRIGLSVVRFVSCVCELAKANGADE